jgi:hypothetical protein
LFHTIKPKENKMTMVNLHIASISVIISTTIILGVGIVLIALTELANFGIAQGQVSNSTPSSSLTPQQKAAMCDPNNPKLNFVNTTESKMCGLPKTVQNTTANITTGAQTPPPPATSTASPAAPSG